MGNVRTRAKGAFARRNAAWLTAVLALTFSVFGILQVQAAGHDPGAEQLSQQIGRALERFADLGTHGPLATPLPTSDVLPGDLAGLARAFDDDAPDAFGGAEAACHDGVDDDSDGIVDDGCGDDPGVTSLADRFVDAIGAGVLNDFDAVFDALEIDEIIGGVSVKIIEAAPLDATGDNVANPDGIDYRQDAAGNIDVAIVIELSTTISAPLALPTELIDLVAVGGGGTFDVPVTLTSNPLQLHYDHALAFDDAAAAAADTLNESVWLVMAPEGELTGGSTAAPSFELGIGDGSPAPVSALAGELDLGFVGVDLSGDSTIALQLLYGLALIDPDSISGTSDGKLDIDELATTGLDELLDLTPQSPTGSLVDATLELGTDLIGEADDTDLTVRYEVPTWGDLGTAAPTFEFPAGGKDLAFFQKLRSFTATEALGGVDRLVGMLTAVQGAGILDLDLPYLDGGTCDNGVDDDGDGTIDDGCLGSPEPADGAPETGALGGYSDVLELGRKLADSITAFLVEPPDPETLGTIIPSFTNAQELAERLGTALGVPVDLELDDAATPRLVFSTELTDSASKPLALQFGDLDIVNDIVISAGGAADLTAGYTIPLDFALDLTPEPTEDGAGPGSCADGVDNGGADDGADGLDTDCATARTLEQRVQVLVGAAADARPEIEATFSLEGSGISAGARVGILEVGITGGTMELGDADLSGDPASISFDLSTEANDGWMTIQEFLAALGNPTAPTWATAWSSDGWRRKVDHSAGFSATLPVGATIGGQTLTGGDIVVTAESSGHLEDVTAATDLDDPANAFQGGALVQDVDVSADLADINPFSACGNGIDDDGDGEIDDGCPGGPDAVEDPETASIDLFDQILSLVRLVAAQLDASSLGGDFSTDIPFIGRSFEDMIDLAAAIEETAEAAALGAESFLPGACDNSADDDGDGYVNDGCPQTGTFAEGGAQCAKGDATNDDAAQDSTDGGSVNDGCPAITPSLQQLDDMLDVLLTELIGQGLGVTLADGAIDATIGYDAAAEEVTFGVDLDVATTTQVPLVAELPDALGESLPDLVSLSSSGVLDLAVAATGTLAFGIELDTLTPFLLGETGLDVSASAAADDLAFQAGIGPITVNVGTAADPAKAHVSGALSVQETGGEGDKRSFPGGGGTPASFDVELGGTEPAGCAGVTVTGFTGDVHACAVLPLYLGTTPLGDETLDPPAHQVRLVAELSSTPDIAVEYPGAADLLENIGNSMIDLLLLESGIGPLVDSLIAKLSNALMAVDLPVIGDALDAVLGLAEALDEGLKGAVTTALSGGDPLETLNPLNANASELAALVQTGLADPLDQALADAGLLLDRTQAGRDPIGAGEPGGVLAVTLCGDSEPCDYGAETEQDSPARIAHDDDTDASNNCEGNGDEDEDGSPNDGCPAVANPEVGADCVDGVDTDGDGVINDGCPPIDQVGDDPDGCDGTDTDGDGTADDGCTWPATAQGADDGESGDDCLNDDDDDGDDVVNDGCPPVFDRAADVTDVALSFRIGQAAATDFDEVDGSVGFDSGIPGLGLSLEVEDLALQASAGWDLDIVIGVSKDHGFYFVTDEDGLYGGDDDVDGEDGLLDEFNADAVVRLSDPDGGPATLKGTLAFLQATATDGLEDYPASQATAPPGLPAFEQPAGVAAGRSFIEVHAKADLRDPGPTQDGRLTAGELARGPSFSDLLRFDFGGRAELHLGLSVGVDESLSEGLPQIVTGMHLVWDWSLLDQSSPDALEPGGPSSELEMWMDRMYLDAGSFVSDFLAPVFTDVQKFTKAFQPIIDVINEPIPVLSDFAGEPVTMRTLGTALAAAYDIDLTLLDMVIDLISFVNAIESFDGSIYIPLTNDANADVALDGELLRKGKLAQSQATEAFEGGLSKFKSDLKGDINGAVGNEGAASTNQSSGGTLKVSNLDSVGVSFPFLDHPERLAGLLFGKHVTLVQWEPPPLILKFCYSQKFGPIWSVPPVFVEFGGCVQLKGEFGIGYNTKGFERAFWSDTPEISGLLQGLFLIDRHPLEGGSDTNELEFRGEIFVNAQVSVLIFSAGAEGKLYITIGIDLQDPNSDGITEFGEAAEIIRTTGSVLCLFNLNGTLGLQFSVFAEVDLFFWSQRWTKVLADIVLFQFKIECEPLEEPELARDGGGGVLYLNVGVDAKYRDADDTGPDDSIGFDVIDEVWTVTRTVDGVSVRALGFTQKYPGAWTKVVVTDAGGGKDKIAFVDGQLGGETDAHCENAIDDDGDGVVNDGCPAVGLPEDAPSNGGSPANCQNGTDEDQAEDEAVAGNARVNDGCPIAGEITLVPFDILVEVNGGGDDDVVTGGVAGGVLKGGDGHDTLIARYNNGLIGGQLATNPLWTIEGGSGNDVITGSPGRDLLLGGPGDDGIDAGPGADEVVGGDGDDTIDGGRDIPKNAEAGLLIDLPDGDDKIWGDNKDDSGTPGRDTIDGGPGADEIRAGGAADRVNGGYGNDKIWGGNEANDGCGGAVDDQLVGGPGADEIRAEDGDDIVVGGNTIAGEPDVGDALLSGGAGCDIVIGDNAVFASDTNPRTFTLLDPAIGGADTIEGGDGDDVVRGQVGGDTISGDTGTNTEAGDGNDQIWGDAGTDDIWGNGGDDRIYGDGGPSHPQFTDATDRIAGGGGNDRIWGEGGDDIILGDDGTFGPTTFVAGAHGVDTINGDAGADAIYGQGSGDLLFGNAGDDEIHGDTDSTQSGEDGADQIRGGTGDDLLFGGDSHDQLWGDAGRDRMAGGSKTAGNADSGTSGTRTDAYAGVAASPIGDRVWGGSGDDVMAGDNATFSGFTITLLDEATIGQGDLIVGQLGGDDMFGENGVDFVYGEDGDDHAEGGADGDVIYGQNGQDDLIGGTTQPAAGNAAGVNGQQPDGDDKIFGGGNADVIVGDNGSITRPGGTDPEGTILRNVTLYDLDTKDATFFGSDRAEGGASTDAIHGGGGSDLLYGYTQGSAGAGLDGDDHIEGNDGGDTIHGDAGQDDLIGGTSAHVDEVADPDPVMPGDGGAHPDDGTDVIHGGDGTTSLAGDFDVIAGDNATIERPIVDDDYVYDDLDPDAPSPRTDTEDVVRRRIVLHDVATTTFDPSSPVGNPADGDELFGDDGWDELYGQGDDDFIYGGDGDDHLEGGAGDDHLYGQAGQDDLVGGTGRTVNDDPTTAEDGRLDGSDTLYGGDGVANETVTEDDFDVELGDNATVLRGEPGDEWSYNTFNASVRRHVYLYDVGMVDDPAGDGTGEGDFLYGEANDDVMFGQAGADEMHGGSGDDAMQGNDGADTMLGGDGNDDMVGGTGRINLDPVQGTPGRLDDGETEMRGGAGHDWMAGDNAIIERVLVDGEWVEDPNGGVYRHVLRMPDLFDQDEPFGGSLDEDQVSGADEISGDAGNDVMYGQGNRALADDVLGDELYGGADDDRIEGGEGGDLIEGGGGEDDLVGGTGKVLGQDSYDVWTDADSDDPDFDLSDEADAALDFGVRHRHDGDDQIHGETGTDDDSATVGGDADVIAGDNAVVRRLVSGDGQFPTDADGVWEVRLENDSVARWIWFPDVESIEDEEDDEVGDHVHGDDSLYGNEGDDEMWGQGGDDLMYGGAGQDRMQGNHASDEMHGGPGEDDMLGGTGRINDDPQEGTRGRVDADDLMFGDDGHDVMTGDNAIVDRPVEDDAWVTIEYLGFPDATHAGKHVSGQQATDNEAPVAVGDMATPVTRIDRVLTMIDLTPTNGGSFRTSGSDLMSGGAGDDDMVGQFDDSGTEVAPFARSRDELVELCAAPDESTILGDGIELEPGVWGIHTYGDVVCGNGGEDAILGDQGVIVNRYEDGSRERLLQPNVPFVRDWIFLEDTLSRLVTLDQWSHGGHDVILGGDHHDSLHAGAGGDLVNGDDGDDFIFGGDGGFIAAGTRQDALWGGRGHDTSFAGHGDDFIDVRPRADIANFPDDPDDWFFFAPVEDGDGYFRGFASIDHHYGGWNQDALQADQGDNGPIHGDRLMDWAGAHNVYYLCPSTYGAWVSLRDQPPGMIDHLEDLAVGMGAVGAGDPGTSGYNEAAIVYKPDVKSNNTPPHPDTPGHFTCDGILSPDPTAG